MGEVEKGEEAEGGDERKGEDLKLRSLLLVEDLIKGVVKYLEVRGMRIVPLLNWKWENTIGLKDNMVTLERG